MESIEMFGRDAQLHAALRRCVPQLAASLEHDHRDLPRVRVAYRNLGPWLVSWDGSSYRWRSGPHTDHLLPADAEQAAAAIAETIGAAVMPSPTEGGRPEPCGPGPDGADPGPRSPATDPRRRCT
ncbi:hypothetical protein [Actinomadura sediminis]|uniref:Uncharacterized protein n=1 Tax=Actinomadura sediminis TaxID=1038904 RepID=A0ABW3ESL8_9ACTN